jgi:diguanylate cyclase (GGDEF)-like protein/PAS domain S-box-containing protein
MGSVWSLEKILFQWFDHAPVAMLITDAEARIVAANRSFICLSGYGADELVGCTPRLLQSDRQDPMVWDIFWSRLMARRAWVGEIWCRRKSGSHFLAQVQLAALPGDSGRIEHSIMVCTDITLRRYQEEWGRRQSFADGLTGCPVQEVFFDRLQCACARFQRNRLRAAVGVIDVDGFSVINHDHGFDIGDEVLREMSRRTRLCLRESDTVARLQGDQFALILGDLSADRDVLSVAGRLMRSLSDPYVVGAQQKIRITVSMGMALLPDDGLTADDLSRCADHALNEARSHGRNGFNVFGREWDWREWDLQSRKVH